MNQLGYEILIIIIGSGYNTILFGGSKAELPKLTVRVKDGIRLMWGGNWYWYCRAGLGDSHLAKRNPIYFFPSGDEFLQFSSLPLLSVNARSVIGMQAKSRAKAKEMLILL
ncbi:hypothetical protein ACOMHN_064724 [Nucella lapillus]